jgi:hypothetical protein
LTCSGRLKLRDNYESPFWHACQFQNDQWETNMEEILAYYQKPGSYTDPQDFRPFLQSLPDDPAAIIEFIKKVLIHPIDARDSQVQFNYKNALRSQIDHRSVDDILANPKVQTLLALNTANLQSSPAQRGILSCDHHAVLFASILRLKGKAVRARCGYATYIVPKMFTPHWVCEVYDETGGRWKYIDPERARIEFELDDFYPGGRVWLELQQGKLRLDQMIPDYRSGLEGVKYRLLNDINGLMKNELLNYDWMLKKARPPKLFSKPLIKLDETDRGLLDELAEFSLDVDAHWRDICDRYASYVTIENLR